MACASRGTTGASFSSGDKCMSARISAFAMPAVALRESGVLRGQKRVFAPAFVAPSQPGSRSRRASWCFDDTICWAWKAGHKEAHSTRSAGCHGKLKTSSALQGASRTHSAASKRRFSSAQDMGISNVQKLGSRRACITLDAASWSLVPLTQAARH